jgi:hypothetical protein
MTAKNLFKTFGVPDAVLAKMTTDVEIELPDGFAEEAATGVKSTWVEFAKNDKATIEPIRTQSYQAGRGGALEEAKKQIASLVGITYNPADPTHADPKQFYDIVKAKVDAPLGDLESKTKAAIEKERAALLADKQNAIDALTAQHGSKIAEVYRDVNLSKEVLAALAGKPLKGGLTLSDIELLAKRDIGGLKIEYGDDHSIKGVLASDGSEFYAEDKITKLTPSQVIAKTLGRYVDDTPEPPRSRVVPNPTGGKPTEGIDPAEAAYMHQVAEKEARQQSKRV